MSDIKLIKLSKLPKGSKFKDEDLFYFTSSDIPLSATYGNFKNQIKQSIAFDFLPTASIGDGLIYESNQWNSRKLNYSDLDGVPIPSPFNYNVDVTFLKSGKNIIVNPDGITQTYVIGDSTFSLTNAYNFLTSLLITTSNQRIDYIVLKPNNRIEYRQGVESQIPLSPSISGNEIILLKLLVSDSGSIVSDNTSSNLNFVNGLTLTGETVSLGGSLSSSTNIITNGFSFEIGGVSFGADTEINNLSLTGLIKDNNGVSPNVNGQVLTYKDGVLIWGSSSNSEVDDIRTLTGTTIGASNLGSFTGSTISNSISIKTALQELEIAVEGVVGNTDLSIGTRNINTTEITSSSGVNVTLPSATTVLSGLLIGTDKTKLDFIAITQAVDMDQIELDVNNTPTKIPFNDGLENVYYLESYIGNTTSLAIIHTATNIFNTVNYSLKEFGGTYIADTTNLTTFNSSLAGIGISTTFDIRITVTFQTGITSGALHLNIKTS